MPGPRAGPPRRSRVHGGHEAHHERRSLASAQQFTGVAPQHAPGRGGRDAPARAVEQPRAEFLFEVADRAADRGDGTPQPEWVRDPELYCHATTRPGARLPHVWLQRGGMPVSTLDLVGRGRFAVLTGITGGEAWTDAARAASERYGVPVEARVIGPGRELEDLFGDWVEAREVGEAGCVLARPDGYVGWRAQDAADAEPRLLDALGRVLGRQQDRTAAARAAE